MDESGPGGHSQRPAPGSRRPTLREVASAAGVSPMTASRALADPAKVRPETRERVLRAVESTGYVRDLVAGGLRTSRSHLVVCLLPTTSGPLFAPTVRSLTDTLEEQGYQLLLGEIGYHDSREDDLVRTVLGRRPDAVATIGLNRRSRSTQILRRSGIPVVEMWETSPDPIDMEVGVDHHALGAAVCTYLVRRGHDRLMCFAGDDARATRRVEGFLRQAQQLGVAEPAVVLTESPTSMGQGRVLLGRVADDGALPGAIFCSSDAMAHGCLTEARHRGLRVPNDVAIIGLGALDFAAHTLPALTTVRIDGRRIGHRAASMLAARLSGHDVFDPVVDIGFDIVDGASS